MANRLIKSKVVKNGKTRINIRIPASLDEFMKEYADNKNTTVTRLVVDYFTVLRDQEKARAI